jgi:hypothetical protein
MVSGLECTRRVDYFAILPALYPLVLYAFLDSCVLGSLEIWHALYYSFIILHTIGYGADAGGKAAAG